MLFIVSNTKCSSDLDKSCILPISFISKLEVIISKNCSNDKFTFSSNSGLKKVNLIDGVFIACPKKNWLTIKFDERLKGYHAYDISFSLHTNVYFENYITNLISMKHFSQGKPSKEWLESLIQNRLNNRTHYKQNLIDTKLEFEMFTEFSKQLWHLDFSKREQTYYLLKFLKLKKLGFFNTLKAIKKIINILFY